jgi:hypothetical protein
MSNPTLIGPLLQAFFAEHLAQHRRVSPPDNCQLSRHIPPNLQWSASIERQLSTSTSVEIAYVGSEASHLDNSRNYNDAPPSQGPVRARRPYPQWGSIRWLGSDAKSYFESLQLRGERRFFPRNVFSGL